jgi:inositol 1,4,5-triphosphate receptor type 1/inositol 1,4,5-triphosphate receptor type 3
MRGFISLSNRLESLTYTEYSRIKLEIEFKLKVCSILDNFLDRR